MPRSWYRLPAPSKPAKVLYAYGIVSEAMFLKHKRNIILYVGVGILSTFSSPNLVIAQSSSTNYMVEETMFGTGGELESTSGSYKAQSSVGSLGVGGSSSTNYDAAGGFLTPNVPFLEMLVTGASVDFGTLSDTAASTGAAQGGACNCSFYVRSYLSSGYVVVTMSNPPTNESGDILTAKSTLGVPSTDPNVEEFGINLVDNTSPNIGGNPANIPDSSFADGEAATGYSTVDQFKYGVGDTIARSQATAGNQAVGRTDYTISYIAKRRSITAAGVYVMNHDIVVVATY